MDGAAHQYAVDATRNGQCHGTDVVVSPLGTDEVNEAVVQRTAASLLIDDLDLNQSHVSTVGLHALRVLDGCQLQAIGFASRLQLIAAAVGSHSLQGARLVGYIVEREKIIVFTTTFTQTFAI